MRFLFCISRINLSDGLPQSRAIYEGLSLWVSHRSDAAAAPSCIEAPTATAKALFRFRAPHPKSKHRRNLLLRGVGKRAESVPRCELPSLAVVWRELRGEEAAR